MSNVFFVSQAPDGSIDFDNRKLNPDDVEDNRETPFSDVLIESFKQNNVVGSTINNYFLNEAPASKSSSAEFDIKNNLTEKQSLDIGRNYFDKAIQSGIQFDDASSFMQVRSDKEFETMLSNVQRRYKGQEIIAKGSVSSQLLGGLISGIADVDALIPVAKVFKTAKAVGRVGNVAREAVEVGATAGLTNLAGEAVLSAQQVGRENQKGMFVDNNYVDALVGGAVIGGVLGGAVGSFRSTVDLNELETRLGREISDEDSIINQPISTFGTSSASAAETRKTTLEEEGLAGGTVTQGVANFLVGKNDLSQNIENPIIKTALAPITGTAKVASKVVKTTLDNPVLGLLQSPFKKSREAVEQLAELSGLKKQKGEKGIAVAKGGSIESLNKLQMGHAIRSHMFGKQKFLEYRNREAQLLGSARAEISDFFTPKERRKFLTENEFFVEVGKAMRRGDKHENNFVVQTAKKYRQEVYDFFKAEAQKQGIMDEDVIVKTAESYLNRLWDTHKIKQNKNKFIDISHDWLIKNQTINNQVQTNIRKLQEKRALLLSENKKSEKSMKNRKKTLDLKQARMDEGFRYLKDIRDRMPVGEKSLENYRDFYETQDAILSELELRGDELSDNANIEIAQTLPEITKQLEDIFVSKKTALESEKKFKAMLRKAQRLEKEQEELSISEPDLLGNQKKKIKSKKGFQLKTKYPVLSSFKGKINTEGFFAEELKAMDVTPKTFPAFFSKNGKYKDIDNITPAEMEDLSQALGQSSNDYLDPDDILNAIRSELAGKPVYMVDEDIIRKTAYDDAQNFKQELENLGLDVNSKDDNLFEQYKQLKQRQEDMAMQTKGDIDVSEFETIANQIDFYDRAEAILPSLKNNLKDAFEKISKIKDAKKVQTSKRLREVIDNVNEFEKTIKKQRDALKRAEKKLYEKESKLALVKGERRIIDSRATKRAKNTMVDFMNRLEQFNLMRSRVDKNAIDISDLDEAIKKELKNYKGRTSDDFINEKIDLDDAIKRVLDKNTQLTDAELRITAQEIADQIISTPDGRLGYYDKAPQGKGGGFSDKDEYTPSPFKERVFMIDDYDVEDFLVSDIRVLSTRHARSVGSYLNMHKRFNGDVDLLDIKRDILQEANDMIQKNPERSDEIQKEADFAIRNLSVLRDRALGRDLMPADPTSGPMRVSRTLRQFNVITMLGDVVTSSLSDLFRIKLVSGNILLNSLKGSGAFKKLLAVMRNGANSTAKREELSRLGVVVEMATNHSFLQMNDIGDAIIPNTKLEKSIQFLADRFGYFSGMTYWQQAMKQITAMTTEDAIIRNIEALIKNPDDMNVKVPLAHNGIDLDMAQQILEQYKVHGENFKGVNLLNGEKWENKEALDALLSAVVSETDRIIITPGYNKSVNLNSHEFFRCISQFKAFFLESTTKLLLRGIQDGATIDNVLSLSLMTGMGMLIYGAKMASSGREVSDDPAIWLIEGFDRAGIGGIFMEMNNTLESGAGIGLRPTFGGGVASRNMMKSTTDALAGPSIGRAETALSILGAIKEGKITSKDAGYILSYLPYINTPIPKHVLNLPQGIKEELTGKEQ